MHRLLRALASQSVGLLALVVALSGGTAYAVGRTVAKNTVVSSSIRNGQVKTPDLAKGAVTTAKLAPGVVPSTTGAYAVSTGDASCNPDTTTYLVCQTGSITLAHPGQLLLLGTVTVHHQTNDAYHALGTCRFDVGGTVLTASQTPVAKDDDDSGNPDTSATTVIGLATTPAGPTTVQLECNDTYYATYPIVRFTMVALDGSAP